MDDINNLPILMVLHPNKKVSALPESLLLADYATIKWSLTSNQLYLCDLNDIVICCKLFLKQSLKNTV